MDTELKTCSKCGETKPVSEFCINRTKKSGLASQCKMCSRASYKKWRDANKEKAKANAKKWREENPEQKKASDKKWRANNPEKVKEQKKRWLENNPENIKDRWKRWHANNPELSRFIQVARNANRSARRLGAPGKLTGSDIQTLFEKYPNCLNPECGATENLSLDHIIPLSVDGGINEISNCQVLCISCNTSKKQQIIDYR